MGKINLDEFYNSVGEDYFKILELTPNKKQKDEIIKIIEDIKKSKIMIDSNNKKKKSKKSTEKMDAHKEGKKLEHLIKYILEESNIFKILQNIHTTSNEIDFVVKLTTNGKYLRSKGIIPMFIPDIFLIECKNYSSTVEVGLVGKFFSLINISNIKLGIFISNFGITGRDKKTWQYASAFVNKINLKYLDSEKVILLDLSLKDIELFVKKENYSFVELIEDIKNKIFLDITSNLEKDIKKHENESKLEF